MSAGPILSLIVAVSSNSVIGRDGDMPWRLSTDLKRFKVNTLGKPLIMGRKTFESIGGKPLPGRPHIVISRNTELALPQEVATATSLDNAVEQAKSIAENTGAQEVVVAGGGEIYRQAMDLCERLYVTHVEAVIEGDTFFPTVDGNVFEIEEEIHVPSGEKDNYPTRFVIYRRRGGVN